MKPLAVSHYQPGFWLSVFLCVYCKLL